MACHKLSTNCIFITIVVYPMHKSTSKANTSSLAHTHWLIYIGNIRECLCKAIHSILFFHPQVKEQDGKKVVTSPLPLLFVRDAIVLMIQCGQHSMKWSDFLANYEMNCNEPFDPNAYGGPSDVKQLLLGCSPWIMVRFCSSVI